jgi:hypothetical protein
MFRPIRQISHWPTGQLIGKAINLLANGKILHMDQPTSQPGNLVYRSTYWQCGQLVYQVHNAKSFHKMTILPANRPIYSSFCLCACCPIVTPAILCSPTVVLVLFLALSLLAAPAHSGPGVQFAQAISVWVVSSDKFPVMLISVTIHYVLNLILFVNTGVEVKVVVVCCRRGNFWWSWKKRIG